MSLTAHGISKAQSTRSAREFWRFDDEEEASTLAKSLGRNYHPASVDLPGRKPSWRVERPVASDTTVAPVTIDAAVTKERTKEVVISERATTDAKVAKAARRRSNGHSEYSGEFTFVRKTGEWGTSLHHPWGRDFDGLAWVINLTGSEHDEVEYGIDGEAMNEKMKAILVALYPEVQR